MNDMSWSDNNIPNKRIKVEVNDESVQTDITSDDLRVKFNDHLWINVTELLSQYECPVCWDYIIPPILQCHNGHVLCGDCLAKLSPKRCPNCREDMPTKETRNHPLERMVLTLGLKFPCKYKDMGCKVTSLMTEKVIHEESCPFKPYTCPSPYGECTWSGTVQHVIPHLNDVHKSANRFGHRKRLYLKLEDLTRVQKCSMYSLVEFQGNHFMWCYYKSVESSNFMFKTFLVFIGDESEANTYRYMFNIEDKSNGNQMVFESRPQSIRQKVSVNTCDGLLFDLITALQFVNNGRLKITLAIQEI